jgi:serine/threonine-protein kinase RsbT
MNMQIDTRFTITENNSAASIAQAREEGRMLALELGFSSSRTVKVTTVISELARNIAMYARNGEISIDLCSGVTINGRRRQGISITAEDAGPGIANPEYALLCGYSTSGSPGVGLTGIHRMADDFSIDSKPGSTTVRAILWTPTPQNEEQTH